MGKRHVSPHAGLSQVAFDVGIHGREDPFLTGRVLTGGTGSPDRRKECAWHGLTCFLSSLWQPLLLSNSSVTARPRPASCCMVMVSGQVVQMEGSACSGHVAARLLHLCLWSPRVPQAWCSDVTEGVERWVARPPPGYLTVFYLLPAH